jgi:hypothetical protein
LGSNPTNRRGDSERVEFSVDPRPLSTTRIGWVFSDAPLPAGPRLLVLDAWEHAYYVRHHNPRAEYVESIWRVINWNDVAQRLARGRIPGCPGLALDLDDLWAEVERAERHGARASTRRR